MADAAILNVVLFLPLAGIALLVAVPAPRGVPGTLHYRRFPLDEPFREIAMGREGDALVGLLPTQPPAGKLEYFATLGTGLGTVRIPDGEPIVMRFKGDVPAGVTLETTGPSESTVNEPL